MALVLNASSQDQTVKVFGNYFTLKTGQIKDFSEHVARFLCTDRKERGFVGLSENFTDPEYKLTPAGKEELLAAKKQGVANRVEFLKSLVYNETVSLQHDLAQKNIKQDPRVHMTETMVKQIEELAAYGQTGVDEQEERVAKIKELEKKLESMN